MFRTVVSKTLPKQGDQKLETKFKQSILFRIVVFKTLPKQSVQKLETKFKQFIIQNTSIQTPLPFNIQLQKERFQTPIQHTSELHSFPYKQIIGSLLYLRLTRFDLLFALHSLSQFSQNPTVESIKCLKHCLTYIINTKHFHRILHGEDTPFSIINLVAFTDAEWATDEISRKSTSGNLIYLGNSLITGRSTGLKLVTSSSASAELIEIFKTAKKLLGLRGIAQQLDTKVHKTCVRSQY